MGKAIISTDSADDRCPYEVDFFEQKHGLPRRAAEVILHTNGPSRNQCDAAAKAYLNYIELRQARQPRLGAKPA